MYIYINLFIYILLNKKKKIYFMKNIYIYLNIFIYYIFYFGMYTLYM